MAAGLLVALVVSVWSMDRVPHASWQPALIGLPPWVVGKYLLCPLRWHALSCSGRNRRWHLRVYAESELLGLASPGTPRRRPVAHAPAAAHRHEPAVARVAEVALDRLVGALGPHRVRARLRRRPAAPGRWSPAVGHRAGVLLVAPWSYASCRPGMLAGRPMPPARSCCAASLISVAYQLTIMGLLIGTVAAMGEQVHPLALLGVFGASQVAGILPGVNGASPREGALVVGLASLGVTWQAALGAVALTALLAWVPALLLGGVELRWSAGCAPRSSAA